MSFDVNGRSYETDEEGYLADLSEWSSDVAGHMAELDDCDLTDNHWEVINFLREYYEEYQIAPAVRVLTKRKVTASTCMNCFPMVRPSRPVNMRDYQNRRVVFER